MAIRQAVIAAGGLGTRLKPVFGERPKALVPVCGISVLERQIDHFAKFGVEEVVLLLGEGAAMIKAHLETLCLDVKVIAVVEPVRMGTAGAIWNARQHLDNRFFFCFGDIVFSTNLRDLANTMVTGTGAMLMTLHPNDHPYDSDLVVLDEDGIVRSISSPPHSIPVRNLANAGIYCIERSFLLEFIEVDVAERFPLDLEKDVIPTAIKTGNVMATVTLEYLRDIGTPERLKRAELDFNAGIPKKLTGRGAGTCLFASFDDVFMEGGGRTTINANGLDIIILAIHHGMRVYITFSDSQHTVTGQRIAELDMLLGKANAFVWGYLVTPEFGPWPRSVFDSAHAHLSRSCLFRQDQWFCFNNDGETEVTPKNELFRDIDQGR